MHSIFYSPIFLRCVDRNRIIFAFAEATEQFSIDLSYTVWLKARNSCTSQSSATVNCIRDPLYRVYPIDRHMHVRLPATGLPSFRCAPVSTSNMNFHTTFDELSACFFVNKCVTNVANAHFCRGAYHSPETWTEFGWKSWAKNNTKMFIEQLHRPVELKLTLIVRIWFRIGIGRMNAVDRWHTVHVFYQRKQKQPNKSTIRGWVPFCAATYRSLIWTKPEIQWSLTNTKNQHPNYRMLFIRCLY